MLFLIKILRKLPHSAAFDKHLTRCAMACIWYDEPLTLAKVFGWRRLTSDAIYIFDFSVTDDDIRRTHELDREFGWSQRYGRHH